MDFRSHVYSPLQNTALWLGAWLYGFESFDDVDYALTELTGPFTAADGTPSRAHLLGEIRSYVQPFMDAANSQPALTLLLGGAGDPVMIEPHAPAYDSATLAGGAILLHSMEWKKYRAVVPLSHGNASQWRCFDMEGILPAPPYLRPGEADSLLVDATNKVADFVEKSGYSTTALRNPRLTVGALSDFYETPGLPDCVPERAAKLIARADRVSAIVETVLAQMGDHSLDPELLGLGRPVRYARMSAVTYALAEWAKLRK